MARCPFAIGFLLLLSPAIDAARRNREQVTNQGSITKSHVSSGELKNKGFLLNPQSADIKSKRLKAPSFTSTKPELVTLVALKVAIIDFGDNSTIEQQLRDSGRYDPESVIPYDGIADTATRNRVFATTPQVARGIPVSLCTVIAQGSADTSLKPYPTLDVHRTTEDSITDCNTQLVSVFTITKTSADEDTLYVLDSGVLDIIKSPKMVCPPKIVSFDLQTDEMKNVTVIENPSCNSIYTLIRVEECPTGKLTAYVADTFAFMLTVTDLTTGTSKHLQSQYFYPKPGFFFTKAGGPSTYLPFGLYGITGDNSCGGKLYVQAHATNIQGVLDKKVVRNATDGDILDITTQVALPGYIPGPSSTVAADPNGQLLFFSSLDQLAIYCWNTSKPPHQRNFRMIAQDNERLQYVSHMSVDPTTQRLYVATNRFTKYLSNTLDFSDYNYRFNYINLTGIVC